MCRQNGLKKRRLRALFARLAAGGGVELAEPGHLLLVVGHLGAQQAYVGDGQVQTVGGQTAGLAAAALDGQLPARLLLVGLLLDGLLRVGLFRVGLLLLDGLLLSILLSSGLPLASMSPIYSMLLLLLLLLDFLFRGGVPT